MNDGLCQCGCGGLAPVAKVNHKALGYVKGEPMKFILGHSMRGRQMSIETRKKMSAAVKGRWQDPEQREKLTAGVRRNIPRGERHHNWKGSDAGLGSIHDWLRLNKERTGVCEHCKATPKKNVGDLAIWATDFANISGFYYRDVNDYVELCRRCHKGFDFGKKFPNIKDVFGDRVLLVTNKEARSSGKD